MFNSPDEFEECKDTFNCKRPKIHDSLKTDVKSSQSSPNLCPRNVQLNMNEEELNQPPTPSSSSNVHSSKNSSNSSINTSSKKESPVNDLLNLNLKDKRSPQSNQSSHSSNHNRPSPPQQNQPNIPCDLLGNFNAQNIDLLNDLMSGDKSSQQRRSTNTSNLDLLNELFHSETNPNGRNSGNPTASSGPDLLSEPNGARASESVLNNKARANNLDPFEELFGSGAAAGGNSQPQPSTSNGLRFPLNSTQPPLKPTQTKPTTSNAKSNSTPKFTASASSSAFQRPQKPDYNRAYFKEPPPSNSNGPKLAQDAFGDLLGDFTKNAQGDWSKNGKSMAQLKREEMVSRRLSFAGFHLQGGLAVFQTKSLNFLKFLSLKQFLF